MEYELIEVLKDIQEELKTTNQRLADIEIDLNRIYNGLP